MGGQAPTWSVVLADRPGHGTRPPRRRRIRGLPGWVPADGEPAVPAVVEPDQPPPLREFADQVALYHEGDRSGDVDQEGFGPGLVDGGAHVVQGGRHGTGPRLPGAERVEAGEREQGPAPVRPLHRDRGQLRVTGGVRTVAGVVAGGDHRHQEPRGAQLGHRVEVAGHGAVGRGDRRPHAGIRLATVACEGGVDLTECVHAHTVRHRSDAWRQPGSGPAPVGVAGRCAATTARRSATWRAACAPSLDWIPSSIRRSWSSPANSTSSSTKGHGSPGR